MILHIDNKCMEISSVVLVWAVWGILREAVFTLDDTSGHYNYL